jgi:putative ABC transport system ATP-binding protein
MNVLTCTAVCKTHKTGSRETRAVDDVDLEVMAGEWLAVMGPSGSGKTTLLHLLGGLDRPDSGTVAVAGTELGSLSERQLAELRRQQIGIVFQSLNLLQDLTVAENIELPLLLAGTARSTARARGRQLLDALGLAGFDASFPSQLSGGEQQRVAIARSVANRPAVLLADEPTGNLDTEAARQVVRLLREEHAAGQTIVLVTHDGRVASAADRVVVMQDGRLSSETAMRPADTSVQLARLVPLDQS